VRLLSLVHDAEGWVFWDALLDHQQEGSDRITASLKAVPRGTAQAQGLRLTRRMRVSVRLYARERPGERFLRCMTAIT